MKKIAMFLVGSVLVAGVAKADLIITGIIDGPRTGGLPKGIEIYVSEDVADLSVWSIASYANGSATPGATVLTLSGSAVAGTYIYAASESTGFTDYFGFAPTFTQATTLNVNGDDTIALRLNSVNVDVFGVIGVDGTGENWEYLDTWFYRNNGTLASTTWNSSDWTSPGVNALDALGISGVNPPATGDPNSALHMPIGTFIVPEPATMSMLLLGLLGARGAIHRRKKI